MARGVRGMKKNKKVNLNDVRVAERMKLAWNVRRQVQQEILQEKLMQCFLMPHEERKCIQQYPEAMQPMIKDFLQKAEKQTTLYRV
jgi:hypothetical protein